MPDCGEAGAKRQRLTLLPALLDHSCRFVADHHGSSIRISRGQIRHHRCICDTQSLNAAEPQSNIDNCIEVRLQMTVVSAHHCPPGNR